MSSLKVTPMIPAHATIAYAYRLSIFRLAYYK